ncbi:MAG TPA: NfeD family protein [Anaerolineaceae bacterium]|jgi:membrane-bound serine protease (ClpP class)|nr:NfeD family protein [Anaerolineaceae bacterium]
MDILLDPNVAYLILVGGFLLAVLALFSPGTGVLEIGAVFLFFLAGYAIYNLPVNWWALAILVIGVFPFLLALRKSGRILYLLISVLALLIGSIFLFREPVAWQPAVSPLLAVVVSLVVTGFLWLVGRKGIEAIEQRPSHLQSLVGAVGETRTPVYHEGSVYVAGELWSAQSETPIPVDTPVRVVNVQGFTLSVEQVPVVNNQSSVANP